MDTFGLKNMTLEQVAREFYFHGKNDALCARSGSEIVGAGEGFTIGGVSLDGVRTYDSAALEVGMSGVGHAIVGDSEAWEKEALRVAGARL